MGSLCIVPDIAIDLGGSFSAEHGVGRLKRSHMSRYKSDIEIDLMLKLKRALDPKNIMNPDKVIDFSRQLEAHG